MSKKRFFLVFVCLLAVFLTGGVKKDPDSPLQQSQPLAEEFMKTLMKELQTAVSSGGPHGAIAICKDVSVQVEEDFKAKHEDILHVRRISLKARNAERHTPDAVQREWLENMEKDWKENPSPKPDVLESATATTVLFPIAIKKSLCLMCHGDSKKFSSRLEEALKTHYPDDNATGYKMGDFRGALTFEWRKASQ